MPDWLIAQWWAYELTNENSNEQYERAYNHRLKGIGTKLRGLS